MGGSTSTRPTPVIPGLAAGENPEPMNATRTQNAAAQNLGALAQLTFK